MFWMILTFILILSPIIIVHEFGHFWVAKKFGIHVKEFGLAFPPRAVKLFTWQGTDFTLNWLPLGGFVKPVGESDPTIPDGLAASSTKARFWTLSAGSLANFILAFFIFLGAFTLYGNNNISVEDIVAGGSAEQAGLQMGDVILAFNGTEIDADAYQSGDADLAQIFANVQTDNTLLILRDGEEMTIAIDPVPVSELSKRGRMGVQLNEITSGKGVGEIEAQVVVAGSPAEAAGIKLRDRFVSINGQDVQGNYELLTEIVSGSPNETLTLVMDRSGEMVELTLIPEEIIEDIQYEEEVGVRSDRLGIYLGSTRSSDSLINAAKTSVSEIWEVSTLPFKIPSMLISKEITAAEARPVSIVGISQMTGLAAESGIETGDWFFLLRMSGMISASLGLMNLLPIPALDGGRILFVIIEWLRGGKRISHEKEQQVHAVGMMLLLALMFMLMFNDILNPINFG